jgi:hypothetical protein
LRGKRLKAKAPYGHWKTMTFLAALRHDRIDAPWVVDGPINGELFRLYVEKVLIPTLKPGSRQSSQPQEQGRSRRDPGRWRKARAGLRQAQTPTRPGSALAPCSIAFYQTNAKHWIDGMALPLKYRSDIYRHIMGYLEICFLDGNLFSTVVFRTL